MATETSTPSTVGGSSGLRTNHTSDDANRDTSQTNAATIIMIMRTGSVAMVKRKSESGGPKARNVQPANSAIVMMDLLRRWQGQMFVCGGLGLAV